MRSYPILKMGRRRRERTISLGFDLYRGASSRPSEWAHSSDALLIVAYGSYGLASRWTCAQIAVSDEGLPATCVDGGSNVSPEDGRLGVYDGPKRKYWVNKDWLFAVPLRAIESSAALEREVVKPLARLLLSNSLADAFEDTKAVTWPSLAPADDV